MSWLTGRFADAENRNDRQTTSATGPPTYWLTRFMILRLLGLVYFLAFLVAANQLVPLIGHHGLSPADLYLHRLDELGGTRNIAFWDVPTLFWFNNSDQALRAVSWIGAAVSFFVLLGYANAVMMFVLWLLYTSIVNVGQVWYSYGWEIQLLETGFIAIFLCPLLDPRPFPRTAPPVIVIWVYRWLIFRIMVGAALIKLRGDACWRDLTCMSYHYETQPIPNRLSWWLHFRPLWFHKLETLWNHFVELIAPWFAFAPRPFRHLSGIVLVTFQMLLIVSGNLSFLNWLTIVPCLACFDDSFWQRLAPRVVLRHWSAAMAQARPAPGQTILACAFTLLVAILSIQPVMNLISPRQIMNTSFERFNLVNTYGAFGSVGRERREIVFEGTSSSTPASGAWKEYEFKAKPGDPYRAPALVAPYHLRLDWQVWFAAMATPGDYPWTFHFVWHLLHNERALSVCSRPILSPTGHPATFAPFSIVIDSHRRRKRMAVGGSAIGLAFGWRRSQPQIRICGALWKRPVG
jgi:hypothetical protein